jgi:hypothetical protein
MGRGGTADFCLATRMKKHELRKSLPDMVLHEQVLLFAAGILWEQASGGLRKLLPGV